MSRVQVLQGVSKDCMIFYFLLKCKNEGMQLSGQSIRFRFWMSKVRFLPCSKLGLFGFDTSLVRFSNTSRFKSVVKSLSVYYLIANNILNLKKKSLLAFAQFFYVQLMNLLSSKLQKSYFFILFLQTTTKLVKRQGFICIVVDVGSTPTSSNSFIFYQHLWPSG